MKKVRSILAIVLALVMVNSFSIYAFAESTSVVKTQDAINQYLQENVENLSNKDREYEECYEYYSESDTDGTPEWVLVYAFCGHYTTPGAPGGAFVYTVCKDYYLDVFGELSSPYEFGYYVYVPKENKVYTLNEAFEAELDNIDYTFTKYLLENHMYDAKVIGDCDNDGKLSVLDATQIQRALAGLTYLMDDVASDCNAEYSERLFSMSDMDRDGECTIMDATAIQMKLARK